MLQNWSLLKFLKTPSEVSYTYIAGFKYLVVVGGILLFGVAWQIVLSQYNPSAKPESPEEPSLNLLDRSACFTAPFMALINPVF